MRFCWGLCLLVFGGLISAEVTLEEVETGGVASFQHAGSLSEVVCHPDGVHVLSSSRDECVRLWELESGKLVRRFTIKGAGSMWGIRFLNDGKEFIAASSSNRVLRFEVATGKVLKTYTHPDDVYRLTLHPDGKHFVAVGSGKIAILWEIESGKKVRTFSGHTGDIYTAILVEDGKRLITGSSDDTMRQWDVESGKCLKTLKEKPKYDSVFTISSSPDGKRFAMVSDDNFVRVFESASLKEVWKTKLSQEGQVVAWSPDGKLVATASDDKNLYLLNSESGKVVRKIKTVNRAHTPIAFSNDGEILISGGDEILHLHNVTSGKRIEPGMGFSEVDMGYNALAVGMGGKKLFYADGSKLIVRDREDPGKNRILKEGGSIASMVVSNDGNLLAIGCQSGAIILRKTSDLEVVSKMSGGSGVMALDFSEDGSRLVTGGTRGIVQLWAVPSGKKLRDFSGHKESVNAVQFLGAGEQVVTGADDNTVRIWSSIDGEQVALYKMTEDPEDLMTLDEGRTLVVAVDEEELYGRILPKLEKKEISNPEQVQELLVQLGDESFQVREDAMKGLAQFGRDVIPLLEEVKTNDPEVMARLMGVRSVMRGSLKGDTLKKMKSFDGVIGGAVADPKGEFWVARFGSSTVGKIVVGVIDYEKKGLEIIQTIDTEHGCDGLSISPDGSHVSSINADGTHSLYRVNRK